MASLTTTLDDDARPLRPGTNSLPLSIQAAIDQLAGRYGVKPKWLNLDGELNNVQSIRALDDAMRHQHPAPTVECLSMRYCSLGDDDTAHAVANMIAANNSIEVLYIHLSTISDKAKDALSTAWRAHGQMHRITNCGMTFNRKLDLAYLSNRQRFVPAWALAPRAKPKKKKKKKGGKGKKKK